MYKTYLTNKILILISFVVFLFLYVIQDARIDLLVKNAVFNTETTMYLISLLFIIVGWICIFCTGGRKAFIIKWKKLDVCLLVFVLSLLVTFCFYSKCQVIVSLKKHEGIIATLLILESLALLALPSLMYVLSWMRGNTQDKLLLCVDSFLHGKRFFYGCVVISIIGLILMIYYSFSLSLWGDEAFSLGLIDNDYATLTHGTAVDVHPPLYYYITKFIVDILVGLFPKLHIIYAARLVSTIPYVLLVLICLTCVRHRWGSFVSGLSAIALVSMSHLLDYGVEIRMYSWGLLWVTCCWLSIYNIFCYDRLRDWGWMILFALAAAYTQYWACATVAILYLILAIWCIKRKKKLRWLIACIVTVIGYLPWLGVFIGQMTKVSHGYWVKPHVWYSNSDSCLTTLFMYSCDNVIVYIALVGIFVAAMKYFQQKITIINFALTGMALPYVLILLGVSVSLLQPMFVVRYLIPATGALWIGGILLARTQRARFMLTLVVISLAMGNMVDFSHTQKQRKEYAQLFLNHIAESDKPVVFVFPKPHRDNTVFSIWTGDPSYLYRADKGWENKEDPPVNNPYYCANGKKLHALKKDYNCVRDLLTPHNIVYFILHNNEEKKEAAKIASEEGLALIDEGLYTMRTFKFYLQRIEIFNPKRASEEVLRGMTAMRLDAKNVGLAQNSLLVKADGAKVTQPKWFENEQGIGQVIETSNQIQIIEITAKNDGNLHLKFRGADKRKDGKRFPLWIDYKSIKIDGKEILSKPVATWHDKPFVYEMPVKDGQKITVEIEQTYHPYTQEELEEVIGKLNPKSDYIMAHLKEVAKDVYELITQEKK